MLPHCPHSPLFEQLRHIAERPWVISAAPSRATFIIMLEWPLLSIELCLSRGYLGRTAVTKSQAMAWLKGGRISEGRVAWPWTRAQQMHSGWINGEENEWVSLLVSEWQAERTPGDLHNPWNILVCQSSHPLINTDNQYSREFWPGGFWHSALECLSSNCFHNLYTQSNVDSSELFIAISLHILKGHSTLIN